MRATCCLIVCEADDTQPSRTKTGEGLLARALLTVSTFMSSRSPDLHVIVSEDAFSPESVNSALPSARPARSPGLRLGLGQRTSSYSRDEPSPGAESPPIPRSGPLAGLAPPSAGAGAGGVKRTKSLMQKIKTMVRTRSGSVESANAPNPPLVRPGLGPGQRSQSMTAGFGARRPSLSPGWDVGRDVVEEEEVVEEDEGAGAGAAAAVSSHGAGSAERRGGDEEQFEDAHEDVFDDVQAGDMGMWKPGGRLVKS